MTSVKERFVLHVKLRAAKMGLSWMSMMWKSYELSMTLLREAYIQPYKNKVTIVEWIEDGDGDGDGDTAPGQAADLTHLPSKSRRILWRLSLSRLIYCWSIRVLSRTRGVLRSYLWGSSGSSSSPSPSLSPKNESGFVMVNNETTGLNEDLIQDKLYDDVADIDVDYAFPELVEMMGSKRHAAGKGIYVVQFVTGVGERGIVIHESLRYALRNAWVMSEARMPLIYGSEPALYVAIGDVEVTDTYNVIRDNLKYPAGITVSVIASIAGVRPGRFRYTCPDTLDDVEVTKDYVVVHSTEGYLSFFEGQGHYLKKKKLT